MFKRFLNGLVFGAGFGIAFVLVWVVGLGYLLPKAMKIPLVEPEFENPRNAEVVRPEPSLRSNSSKEFDLFKSSEYRMQIPENGGILSLSPTSTPADTKRPNTYQLWLTDSELWQVRTVGERTEIEKLPYPDGASVETLDALIRQKLGFSARQSSMTISEDEIQRLKSNEESLRDQTMNGKLRITIEGVVFILPDTY